MISGLEEMAEQHGLLASLRRSRCGPASDILGRDTEMSAYARFVLIRY
jgi:hypothetical protein